jgi:hypothetical protein
MNEITVRFKITRGRVLLSLSGDELAEYAQVIVSSLVPIVLQCEADAEMVAFGLIGACANPRS